MPRGVASASRPDRPVLLALCADYTAVERIRRGVGQEFALVRCATVAQAREALALGKPAALLCSASDGDSRPTAPFVLQLRSVCGDVPVIALLRRAEALSPAAVSLLATGPAATATVEDLDLASVQRVLASRVWRAEFVACVWPMLEPDVPYALRAVLRYALARAGEPLRVQTIADALGLHRKTLWTRCRRHGMGNMRALTRWCRLLAAAHALRTLPRTVDAVADELRFPSPTALRNAVRRHLRTTPSALRASGGERVACAAFRAWIRAHLTPPVVTRCDVA